MTPRAAALARVVRAAPFAVCAGCMVYLAVTPNHFSWLAWLMAAVYSAAGLAAARAGRG